MLRTIALVLLHGLVALSCGDDAGSAPQGGGAPAGPPFTLIDVTQRSGIDFVTRSGTPLQRYIVEVKSTGVGLLDYDGDGRLDVVLTAGSTLERVREGRPGFGVRLYRNLGGLRFEDATEASGLPEMGWANAPVCADFDGDGWTDLYVTAFGRSRLFRNVKGRFEEVTDRAGVGHEGWSTSAVFHDFDGDGHLDLYVARYLAFDLADPPEHGRRGLSCLWKGEEVMCGPRGLPPQGDVCYRNEGDGTFTDVTHEWGIAALAPSYGLGVLAGDFDGDGAPELYVANDGMPNFWLDWEDGRFVENGYFRGVSASQDGSPQAGMGVDAADLNGDGLDDLVCTNFSGEVNDLYLSSRDGFYREASAETGTGLSNLASLGWGVALRDFDLDGRLDLFVANGHVYPQAVRPKTGTDYPQYNTLHLGTDGAFAEVDRRTAPGLATKKVSRAAAFGDLDDDGDIDVIVVNLNDTCTVLETRVDRARLRRHFLGVALRGPPGNTDGIGARVTVATANRRQTLEARRQASFQASNDPRLLFGLGEDEEILELSVRWPDGRIEQFSAEPDRYVKLAYGGGE